MYFILPSLKHVFDKAASKACNQSAPLDHIGSFGRSNFQLAQVKNMVFRLLVMSCLAVPQHASFFFFFQLDWFQENDTCFGFRSHPTVGEPDLDMVSLILSLILPLLFLGPLLSVEQVFGP